MKKILVTGALGQIGSKLVMALREAYGNDNVIAGDVSTKGSEEVMQSGPFEIIDVTDKDKIYEVVKKYNVDAIYHLATLLSATGELLCDYYHQKYGIDTRGVRFSDLISHKSLPGGGTTDYAITALIQLMEADPSKLVYRNTFNITAMSFLLN